MDKIKEFIMKNKILCISLSSVLVICIIAGTIIGVNSKKEPKKQEKKNESSMSSAVSDNNNSEYTTSVNENGETVVVDKNGDVVSDASVSENGDIVVKDKTGKETVAVKAKDVKKYTDKETENNNSTVGSESHAESSSVPSASNSSSTANKPSGSGSGSNKPSTGQGSGGSQTTTPSMGGGTTPSQPNQPAQSNNQLPTASQLAAIENDFFNLVNEERARVGAPALTRNATLNQAAKIRANEQLTLHSHTRPNGTDWSTVLQDIKYGTLEERITSSDGINWTKEMVYSYGGGAEILGYSGGSTYSNIINSYAKQSFLGFRYSPGHYSAMINSTYKNTGIAISFNETENNGVKMLNMYIIELFTVE